MQDLNFIRLTTSLTPHSTRVREKNPAPSNNTGYRLDAYPQLTAVGCVLRTAGRALSPLPVNNQRFPSYRDNQSSLPSFSPSSLPPPSHHLYAWRDNDTLLSRTHTGRLMIRRKFWNLYAKSIHTHTCFLFTYC